MEPAIYDFMRQIYSLPTVPSSPLPASEEVILGAMLKNWVDESDGRYVFTPMGRKAFSNALIARGH